MWMWSTGINRNIVECKDTCALQNTMNNNVLIETLWNVKLNPDIGDMYNIGINRNIVECKAAFREL